MNMNRYDVLINDDDAVCIARLANDQPLPQALLIRDGRLHEMHADGRCESVGMLTSVAEKRLRRETEVVVVTVTDHARIIDGSVVSLERL